MADDADLVEIFEELLRSGELGPKAQVFTATLIKEHLELADRLDDTIVALNNRLRGVVALVAALSGDSGARDEAMRVMQEVELEAGEARLIADLEEWLNGEGGSEPLA